MDDVRRTLATWAIAASAVFIAAGEAAAQIDLGAWLRGESSRPVGAAYAMSPGNARRVVSRGPYQGSLQAAAFEDDGQGMANEIIFESPVEEVVVDDATTPAGWNTPCVSACGPGCGAGCGMCPAGCCGPCNAPVSPTGIECGGDGYGTCSGYPVNSPYWCQPVGCCGLVPGFWQNFSLHMGVHGFKGPVDFGRNGNFGLHEGFNYAGPFGGPWGFGYQFGLNLVHSNFSGDQAIEERGGDRDQVFFTGGIFRRAPSGGWQWGVAVDLLHDSYYETVNISQVRSESSFVFPGGIREIGYFGMYGTGDDRIERVNEMQIEFEPTDLFAFFYRRHFSGGGNGRIWAGFSGAGDGLVGADLHVPLGEGRWSLVNRFNYLIPKEGSGSDGISEESWGVTIQLVWYPGQPARCAERDRFHALFDVADNTLFMVDRGNYGGAP